jgi:hypothetical protein
MTGQWYYSHDGITHGPFSEDELQDRVERGMLIQSDRLWPVGREPRHAAPAPVVLDFSKAPASALPDWLADVVAAQTKGPIPGPEPTDEIPEWLDDLRLWVALDLCMPASEESNSDSTLAIPDWLESWLTPPPQIQPPAAPPSPITPRPAVVSPPLAEKPLPLSEPRTPVSRSVPSEAVKPRPAIPSQPPAPSVASISPPPAHSHPVSAQVQVPTLIPAPPAAPTPLQAKTTPAPSKLVNPLVEKTLHVSGFDLETGQILDPEKFRKWKQEQVQISSTALPAVSNAGLFEVFRKARSAVEAWVDNETNRPAVMNSEIDEIKSRPEIQLVLKEYAGYGMREKLLRHLEFMVENRRKYYKAIAALSAKPK